MKTIFAVYLGIYAYNNPEPQAYYLEPTSTEPAQLVPLADTNAEGVVPIHDQFILWFTWMFYSQLVWFPFACTTIVLLRMNLRGTFQLLFCGLNCNAFVVYILGIVYRFGEAGRYASNGYLDPGAEPTLLMQPKNGFFLALFYILTWSLLGCCCLCGCCFYAASVVK